MTIGENIRELRLQKRLSQEYLGELLGVSAQAVSKWEQGSNLPDISLLPRMAECFGVPIDCFFYGVGPKKYTGYGGERGELYAMYTRECGTEKDFKRAADAYREVILGGKATIEDYVCYGNLHRVRASRDLEKALYYYRFAIKEGNERRDMQWMAAHQCLTNLLVDLGRAAEAVAEQWEWREKEPNSVWARIAYAYALKRNGRLEEAFEEVKEALIIDGDDINVLTFAGDICAQMGRYAEALAFWDKITDDSLSISHLFSKAELYASLGEKEKAIRQYEEILEWLERHEYNMLLEGAYPRKRIMELQNKCTNNGLS